MTSWCGQCVTPGAPQTVVDTASDPLIGNPEIATDSGEYAAQSFTVQQTGALQTIWVLGRKSAFMNLTAQLLGGACGLGTSSQTCEHIVTVPGELVPGTSQVLRFDFGSTPVGPGKYTVIFFGAEDVWAVEILGGGGSVYSGGMAGIRTTNSFYPDPLPKHDLEFKVVMNTCP